MSVSQRDKRWKEKGWKDQEAGSEKKKVESKRKRSPENKGKLWDNKKSRSYEWSQKAGLEERDE